MVDVKSQLGRVFYQVHVQKKYFKAWRLGAGMDKKQPSETDPIMPKDDKEVEKQVFYYKTLHPNISMHILHTVLSTFPKVLARRICLPIKSFFCR